MRSKTLSFLLDEAVDIDEYGGWYGGALEHHCVQSVYLLQAMVVIKYLFQFGFFPWNDGTVHESPFFPPRILGIEQKVSYANVDIALLLALFIHRSILKVSWRILLSNMLA